jgi:hypothetical protein
MPSLQAVRLDGQGETTGSFEIPDLGAVGLESIDQRADRPLLHPGVTGDGRGGSVGADTVDNGANGSQEPGGCTGVSEVERFVSLWHDETSLSAFDDDSVTSIFPRKLGSL